jgi:sugar phosphate isomerase/epimerase
VRFACSTASFPEDRLSIAIAKVAWAGYQEVELHLPGLAAEPLPELQARLNANELRVAAVRAGVLPPEGGEVGVEALTRIGELAAMARSLDCSVLVVETPASGDPAGVARALRMLDGALGGAALDLCVVNAPGTLLAVPEGLHALWGEGLPERVGLALDPGRALLAGWNPADLDVLPELPRHVYLNDAHADRIVPPGEGDLDLEGLGEALRQNGYGGVVSVRLENADAWAVEPVVRELRTAVEAWFS